MNNSAIVMGAGTDSFHMMNSTGGAQAELLGMETIKTLDAADTNIDMAKATATPEFNVAGGSTSITLSNLINGSSLRTSDLSTSGNISIGYRNSASDAALVVDLETQHNGADDAISFTNVSDVTLNVQNGLYAVGGGAAPTVTLDDTSLAAGIVSDVVKSVTINNTGVATNGTDDVVLGNVASSSRLETLTLNATGAAVTVGTIAEAESLTNLNIDSTGGEVTVGAIGGTAASTGLSSINVAATEDVFLGAVAANNTGGVTDVTLAAADGDITGLVLTNDAGSIDTVTLSGAGDVTATFNTVLRGSGTAGYTKAINSTNTGSVNLTVSNAAASGAGTVVTLGDGSNTVTMLSSMNDVITGGAGSDTLVLGSGASSSRGSNTVDLGAGTDVLSFDVAGVAEANGIIINVGSSDAFLNGASGGTAASDELVATLTAYSRSNDDGNTAGTIATFTGVERFVGTDQADIMISGATGANMNGAAGDDVINGGTGGDTITGGEGQDTILAGGGDDIINLTSQAADGTDDIDGGSGIDTIVLGGGSTFVFSTADSKLKNVENVQLGANASFTLTGQNENFNVIGGGGNETVISGSGDDTINGRFGDDFIQAAAGADVINGGAGHDTVSYADVTGATSHGATATTGMAINLSGTAIIEADVTLAMGGATVLGTEGAAALAANSVQYIVTAAADENDDVYLVDTVTSIESVVGSALADFIVLGAGGMNAAGGAGNDVIIGGTGNDTIDGGTGADILIGGVGQDKFILMRDAPGVEFDTINDFAIGDNTSPSSYSDTLVFSRIAVAQESDRVNFREGPVSLSSTATIESYSVNENGFVTLFDRPVGAGITILHPETTSDMIAVANAIFEDLGSVETSTFVFGVDADRDGSVDSMFVASRNASGQGEFAHLLDIVDVDGVGTGEALIKLETGSQIVGDTTGLVIEGTAEMLSTFGVLSLSGVHSVDDNFVPQLNVAGENGYGTFTVTEDGRWTYIADNEQSAVQSLGPDDTLIDSFAVVATNGASLEVTVTLKGAVGYVVDGYLSGSTVFRDANGDGLLTSGEFSTITDALGRYDPDDLPGVGNWFLRDLCGLMGSDASAAIPDVVVGT